MIKQKPLFINETVQRKMVVRNPGPAEDWITCWSMKQLLVTTSAWKMSNVVFLKNHPKACFRLRKTERKS